MALNVDLKREVAMTQMTDKDLSVPVPILIICYNNAKYVDQMVSGLCNVLTNPNIIIIDNNSSCKYTKDYLSKTTHRVIQRTNNDGHMVWMADDIFPTLPDQFILTDPDIQLPDGLEPTFIETLVHISSKYHAQRVGFALDISEPEKMFPYRFCDFGYSGITTIWESQLQYWKNPITTETEFELYFADIDTTFCLYNKKFQGRHIRVGGKYTAKHLPWYTHVEGVSRFERHLMYRDASKSSSIRCFEDQYMKDHQFVILQKMGEDVMVQLDGSADDDFWLNEYHDWGDQTFHVLRRYLQHDKQYLEIGAGVGFTCVYAMKIACQVVCVETDSNLLEKLKRNVENNQCYCRVDIVEEGFGQDMELDTIIRKYKLDNLCLVHINLDGDEEDHMNDLSKLNNVPVLVQFNISRWKSQDLSRFSFLTEEHKQQLTAHPRSPILFQF